MQNVQLKGHALNPAIQNDWNKMTQVGFGTWSSPKSHLFSFPQEGSRWEAISSTSVHPERDGREGKSIPRKMFGINILKISEE